MSEVNDFLSSLTDRLGTCFITPEEEIIKKGEKERLLYYIMQGDCVIGNEYKGQDIKKLKQIQMLVEGDQFGEIGLIFNCQRTCTIISRSYSTMARLTYNRYRMLASDFPNFRKQMIKQIGRYKDDRMKFLKRIITKLPFFQFQKKECILEAMFSLKQKTFFAGEFIAKAGDFADSIFIIEDGGCEVFAVFEGHEFIIDYLSKGSIINYRLFIVQDLLHVFVRCTKYTRVLKLTQGIFENLQDKYPEFKKTTLKYQHQILKYNENYPLDYLRNEQGICSEVFVKSKQFRLSK